MPTRLCIVLLVISQLFFTSCAHKKKIEHDLEDPAPIEATDAIAKHVVELSFEIPKEKSDFFASNVYKLGEHEAYASPLEQTVNDLKFSLIGLTNQSFRVGHYIEKANVQGVFWAHKLKRLGTSFVILFIDDATIIKNFDNFSKSIPKGIIDAILVPQVGKKNVHEMKNGILVKSIDLTNTTKLDLQFTIGIVKGKKPMILGN